MIMIREFIGGALFMAALFALVAFFLAM